MSYNSNDLDGIESISIMDNGKGIVYENLENTFSAFLSSEKKVNSNDITMIHGSRGKGRFSFLGFADKCTWKTVYTDKDANYEFSINISSEKKNKYTHTEKQQTNKKKNGTKVFIYNIQNLMKEQMESKELKETILESFAWYLYLKKNENCKIILNGNEIKYEDFIDTKLTEDFEEIIDDKKFKIYFVNWKGNVKYKYYFHMLDENSNQKAIQHTKYNNNGIGFVHSVFVTSNYFNGFESLKNDENEIEGQIRINIDNKRNEKDKTYKELLIKLESIVNKKYKEFISEKSNNLIKSFEDDNIFPEFTKDIYGKIRKKELINTVKEVYCSQPKIFKGANPEQKKIIVHFLNLLLNSDERENILNIMENVTNLSKQERDNLSKVLTRTSLSCIVETIKMLDEEIWL